VTNYCQNRLTIEGPSAEIGAFAQDCLSLHDGLHLLDFEKILPMPPVLKGLHRSVVSRLGGEFPNRLSSGVVGMEALTRKPVQPVEGFTKAESVLDNARVKEIGLRTYDDLDLWLRKNDPASLELGRKCLAAFDACGCYFEGDWVLGKWGCDPDRVEYSQADLGETSYHAAVVSPFGAPEGILREVARRHSGLTSRFTALEEGNDYAFLLTTSNGVVNEERPAITDTFIEEVDGPGEVTSRLDNEREFYEEPAILNTQQIRHIRHWMSEARLKRALAGYPVYTPPHLGVEWMMSEQQAHENFEFFLAQKANRVDAMRPLLAQFDIQLDFTDRAKEALDSWLTTHGAFLYVSETGSSFLTHNPEWVGPRSGLNVILDLAIFIGEFAIRESPGLGWEMDARRELGRTRSDHGFQRPAIGSASPLFSFPRDVIYETYNICHSLCEASYMWKKPRFQYGSALLARHFVTKTLRHTYLCARDDFETANNEWIQDSRAR
jgi:hypothetical protein